MATFLEKFEKLLTFINKFPTLRDKIANDVPFILTPVVATRCRSICPWTPQAVVQFYIAAQLAMGDLLLMENFSLGAKFSHVLLSAEELCGLIQFLEKI